MLKLFLYCFRVFDEKEYFEELCKSHDFTYGYTSDYPTTENANLSKGYDGISVTPTMLNAELLEKFHSLGVRYILTRSIGYDHIDMRKANELGLKVSHVKYRPETVADYAVMLMMMSLRKMRLIMEQASIQDFSLCGKIGRNIGDCTIGVVGTGQIGQTVIKHLSALGCRILAYDPYVNTEITSLCEYVTLQQLYKECDVITLHVPATDANYHLLNHSAFCSMKSGVIIINTARGTLIDTEALIAALENGQIGGAALDVLEDERGLYFLNRVGDCIANRQLAILRSFPNVILTPHTAFYTENVVKGMAKSTIECLLDMADNRQNPLIISNL